LALIRLTFQFLGLFGILARELGELSAVAMVLTLVQKLLGFGQCVLHQPDLASLFTKTTGGRTMNFLKKNALEQAIQLVGEEVHRQYVLSFQPKGAEPGKFHAIRVTVKNRPELAAKTREGYWALE
jgi:hypothetical protein